MSKHAAIAVLVVATAPFVARSQVCTNDQLDQIADRAIALRDANVRNVTNDIVDNVPTTVPGSKQITAPAANGGDSVLADGADFNRLLGLAVENGLATSSSDGLTFNLNLFAFKAAVDRSVIEEQSRYEQHAFMRRFSGALTFGGKGEALDVDGDGVVEAAKDPESLADIVTMDFRFRLSKRSRDRRDPENYSLIQSSVASSLGEVDRIQNSILTDMTANGLVLTSPDCQRQFAERLATYDELKLSALGLALNSVDVDYAAAVEQIDARTIWSLALTGTQREREFGRDQLRVGVRGAMGGDVGGWTFNFDYGEVESLTDGVDDAKSSRAALEWKNRLLVGLAGTEGLDVSLSAAVEHYEDVPDVLHDRVGKVNARFVYPLTKTIKIPISVTWANHADLLTDESDVRGNIGFTIDFDPLMKIE
jgi:hypothetical protein